MFFPFLNFDFLTTEDTEFFHRAAQGICHKGTKTGRDTKFELLVNYYALPILTFEF
jgi:hypothetical protein